MVRGVENLLDGVHFVNEVVLARLLALQDLFPLHLVGCFRVQGG